AADFVRHAIGLCPYVAMLLRHAFYESECRSDILDAHPPARIHVFKKRLPMMHRAGWTGKKASSAIAFAWFVWDGHPPYTTIDRIYLFLTLFFLASCRSRQEVFHESEERQVQIRDAEGCRVRQGRRRPHVRRAGGRAANLRAYRAGR